MSTISPSWIERDGRRTHAVVTLEEWEAIEALIEEARDIHDAERVLVDRADDVMAATVVDAILAGAHPVRALRQHAGMSQAALAERAGVSQAMVANVESRRRTGTIDVLRKLAAALGVSVDTLTGWEWSGQP